MFYKMYKNRYLTGKKLDEETMKGIYTGFQEIYEMHGVKVVGAVTLNLLPSSPE